MQIKMFVKYFQKRKKKPNKINVFGIIRFVIRRLR